VKACGHQHDAVLILSSEQNLVFGKIKCDLIVIFLACQNSSLGLSDELICQDCSLLTVTSAYEKKGGGALPPIYYSRHHEYPLRFIFLQASSLN